MSDYGRWSTPALIDRLAYWRERQHADGPLYWMVERCEQILREIRRRDPLFEKPPHHKTIEVEK